MTNSINTNAPALVALQNLAAINLELASTQDRISTGLEISGADDNGALFAVAQGLRGDIAVRDSIGSQLNFGLAVVGVALAGAESLSNNLNTFRATLVDLGNEGLSSANAQLLTTRLSDIILDLSAAINNSTFNGINLLGGTSSTLRQTVTVVGNVDGTVVTLSAGLVGSSSIPGFTQAGSADAVGGFTGFNTFIQDLSAAVGGLSAAISNGQIGSAVAAILTGDISGAEALFTDVVTADGRTITAEEQANALENFTSAISIVLNNLGSVSIRFEEQVEFNQALQDATEIGLGALVDADLARESAELQALQVQQQLATSALGIANGAPSILLSLF